MQTQINVRQEKTISRKLRQCLGLLFFSLVLTACGQGSDSQQGVISDYQLSAPLPKAIVIRSTDDSILIVDMVVNGNTDNPLRVENLVVDTTAGTFSGSVPKFLTGTYTLVLVYSITYPTLGTIEVMRTSDITVNVVANENTFADFSDADIFYTVSGQVEGLTGSELILQNNGSDVRIINKDGTFSFSSTAVDGDKYAVSVLTQPTNPNQTCTVNNGNGTVSGAAVINVTVTCAITPYTVGGTVFGYTSSGLVLQNNGGDNLMISASGNGNFTFATALADGSEYAISVQTQPSSPNQVCTVNNGSGTVSGAAVSSVSVICNTNAAPTATDVTIDDVNGGNTAVGNLLKGHYTYGDAENDTEGESTFRWLADGDAIAGATTDSYVPVASDTGKTITFEVTPVAITGVTPGVPASSGGLVIVANSAPFFTSGIVISVAENIAVTGYTATAKDLDGDTVTFSLGVSGGTDQAVFSIDSDSGVLSFNISTRFKTPADSDGDNTYEVEITATDGIHSIERIVTVTVIMAILEIEVTPDIKTVRFEWPAYVDATSYKLFVNSDASSGFSPVQDNFSETSTTITLPVHLTDWINVRYILEAYDASGNKLTESSPVSIGPMMLSTIGYFKASNIEVDDWFGRAVSLSGDGNTLAVGANGEDSIATGACTGSGCSGEDDNTASGSGAVYVFSRNGDVWEQQAYVKASNTEAGDNFGRAVNLSHDGNTLVVGAIGEDSATTGEDDNTASDSGAVYVFSRNGGVWEQQAYVKASNTGESDFFGLVVSLSGDGNTLVVGATGEDSIATGVSTNASGEDDNTASRAGAVYVFSRSDDAWSQQAYVKASNTGSGDWFGNAMSLSGDGNMLAVGAPWENSDAISSGAVYVFSRSDGVWSQQTYVKASNPGTGDGFGSAVSLSSNGNTLAVGALGEGSIATGVSTDGSGEDDNTANNTGAVYVFSRSDAVWSQQAYVKASNTGAADRFGSAVSLSGDGNMLVVGAPWEDSGATGISTDSSGEDDNTADNPGAVYVFNRSGDIWVQQVYVKASNVGWNKSFGDAVSLSDNGNTLAVGAYQESGANYSISEAGAVYLY